MRGRLSRRLLVVVGVLVVALVAPLPSIGGPLATPCADAAGTGVAVVVDFGDVPGSGARPGGLDTRCVPHSGGLTGAAALIEAGYELRFGTGGLLCAINGYPADGCGERTGSRQYLYWSYWKGDGSTWQYSGSGPGVRVREGATEGWRFVDGAGSPNDPRPRHAADHDAICAEPAPAPPPSPGPQVLDDVPPSASGPFAPEVATTTAPGAPPDAGVAAPTSPPTTPTDGTVLAVRNDDEALGDASPASRQRDLGSAVGFVVVGGLIVVLFGAAIVRSRRRT